VFEQTELLERREAEYRHQIALLQRDKDREIAQAKLDAQRAIKKQQEIEMSLREREMQIAYLLHRCSFLDQAASYAPLLENLAECLKAAFASPPPKVQPVKPTQYYLSNGGGGGENGAAAEEVKIATPKATNEKQMAAAMVAVNQTNASPQGLGTMSHKPAGVMTPQQQRVIHTKVDVGNQALVMIPSSRKANN